MQCDYVLKMQICFCNYISLINLNSFAKMFFTFKLFIAMICSTNSTTAFGQGFEHVLFFMGFLNLANKHFFHHPLIMIPVKHKASDQERAGQAAKRGLAAVEDMFKCETLQFEAELEAVGLPIDASPLEAAMALAVREEAIPLHQLSSISVY